MSEEFLDAINQGRRGLLREYIDGLDHQPRIAYYPSAGTDYRPFLYLRPEFAAVSPPTQPEPAPPDLFLFSDYLCGQIPDEGDILHDDGRTRIMVLAKEDLGKLELANDEDIVELSRTEGGDATFFYAHVASEEYEKDYIVPAIYVKAENEAFCSRFLIPNHAKVSHIIRVRYGYPSGLGRANGGWIENVLTKLGTEVLICDTHDGSSPGDIAAIRLYPNLESDGSRPHFETIRTLKSEAWSGHGDVSWKLITGSASRSDAKADGGMSDEPEMGSDLYVAMDVAHLIHTIMDDDWMKGLEKYKIVPNSIFLHVLGRTIADAAGYRMGDFNLYPGDGNAPCRHTAYFVVTEGLNLDGPSMGQPDSMKMGLEKAFDMIIAHMQGKCCGATQKAVLITPEWSVESSMKWKDNIEKIREKATIRIFLIHEDTATEIKF